MKSVLTFIFITFSLLSFSQGTYKIASDGKISSFYKKTEFYNFCEVDFDFDQASNCMEVPTSVIFDIDSEGTGTFHLYVEKKTSFKIISCYKSDNSFQFNLENINGTKFKAALYLKGNTIDKFYFQSILDNTGYMLY